jgi:hypothetical protein
LANGVLKDWVSIGPRLFRHGNFSDDIKDEHPAIVCRYVWLAGADDLRAWGQQVAGQAACERFLDFSPDIKAKPPSLLVWPDGTVCNHYAVRFNLTKCPSLIRDSGICRYQNMAADEKGVCSIPISQVEALPAVKGWKNEI